MLTPTTPLPETTLEEVMGHSAHNYPEISIDRASQMPNPPYQRTKFSSYNQAQHHLT